MSITYIFMPALSVKLMSVPIYLTFVKKPKQTNKQKNLLNTKFNKKVSFLCNVGPLRGHIPCNCRCTRINGCSIYLEHLWVPIPGFKQTRSFKLSATALHQTAIRGHNYTKFNRRVGEFLKWQ